MSDLVKMEGGSPYPAWCFLDKLDPNVPTSWGLRTHELVHGEYIITKRQLDRASAALMSPGYMGNRSHKISHGHSFNLLREDMIDRYRQIGVPDYDIPSGLFPSGQAPNKPVSSLDLGPLKPRYAPYEELAHFGVKGMRWGVRRQRGSDGRVKRAKASSLSDEELRNTVKRMQLERNYRDLVSAESKANAGKLSRGKGAVEKAMKDAGQEALKNAFAQTIKIGGNYTIDRAIKEANEQPLLAPYAKRAETVKTILTKK